MVVNCTFLGRYLILFYKYKKNMFHKTISLYLHFKDTFISVHHV